MDNLDDLLIETERLAKHMSAYQQDLAPDLLTPSVQGSEALLERCETVWAQMEECQKKLAMKEPEVLPRSDVQLFLLLMKAKALKAELGQWQEATPELISNDKDDLLVAGKQELQNVDRELELILSTVQAENKKLKTDLLKEEQWLMEQELILEALKGKLEEAKSQNEKSQNEKISENKRMQNRALELKNTILNLQASRQELLIAIGEFSDDHFPVPEEHGVRAKKKKGAAKQPPVQWISIRLIIEALLNQHLQTPNDPYIVIKDVYWPPYIELMLRYGIVRRHPEDAQRIRLEAFHL